MGSSVASPNLASSSPQSSNLKSWIERIWQDLQPTPGRLNSSLRIVLATVITLILVMALRMPFASIGLYFIFLVGRDSPSVSVRSGFLSLMALAASAATVLAVVSLTDNDPIARLLSVSIVTFMAGMLMLSTNIAVLASTWGFIYCTLIALWETHAPAGYLVKLTLYAVGTVALSVVCSIAVEYVFGNKDPVKELQNQRRIRYQALETLFSLYAEGASGEQTQAAELAVLRLSATGQSAMQQLYNTIVDRNLDPGSLPLGTRVRITMQAQLMDIAAAFGTQNPTVTDPELRRRCAHIAEICRALKTDSRPPSDWTTAHRTGEAIALIDRVDAILHDILSMPLRTGEKEDKELIALPSSKVSIFIPGAFTNRQTVAFALKISLCATLCYIIVRAVDWPGISTSVITVLITGLSTSSAIKQKLIFRLVGSLIGGLILGLGATVYLFPYMDSISSLVILVAAVAFLSAWWAAGRQFNYIGLQIAFAFYLVAFEGFSAPTELAPARDRFIGIILALVVMAFVFDLIWPVRTVTVMRNALAGVLQSEAKFLRLEKSSASYAEVQRNADQLRDQIGKTVAGIRTMNDTLEYEFGVDREQHQRSGKLILQAALSSVAFFWNQFAALHSPRAHDFLAQSDLSTMRRDMADGLTIMANSVLQKTTFNEITPGAMLDPALFSSPLYGEYAQNSVDRFEELQSLIDDLRERV
jgi:multidrug resistance protein MdtO